MVLLRLSDEKIGTIFREFERNVFSKVCFSFLNYIHFLGLNVAFFKEWITVRMAFLAFVIHSTCRPQSFFFLFDCIKKPIQNCEQLCFIIAIACSFRTPGWISIQFTTSERKRLTNALTAVFKNELFLLKIQFNPKI